MRRDHWQRVICGLDPDTQYTEIYRILFTHEFPWDLNQALSFALFRTYAVPSIGRLLDRTGEFQERTQKRYDDTVLLLEAPMLHGFASPPARIALRRINGMHRAYDISNEDFVYVLSTFVVVPQRWLAQYGYRPLSEREVRASVHHYRELGRHMGLRDVPETFAGFASLLDAYEQEHFTPDASSRRVADATLALMATFYPKPAAKAVHLFSRGLMDPPLLAALGYCEPGPVVRRLAGGALKLRAAGLRRFSARTRPKLAQDLPTVRSYPGGFDLAALGTCPVAAPNA